MYNKKNGAFTVAGIVAGTIVGVAAVAAGAIALYKRYFEKQIISCCEFGLCNGDDCDCDCDGCDCGCGCDDCAAQCPDECEGIADEAVD